MPREFFKLLQKRFLEPDYLLDNDGYEFITLSRVGLFTGRSLQQIKEIAERNCGKLEFSVYQADSECTFSSKGSPVITFPRSNHFICFMPPKNEDLASIISLSWRGKLGLTGRERKIYLGILEDYFISDC
jgi:hypothetical protein